MIFKTLKISVVTIVFNSVTTIRATIESVISQTYDNVELVIVDGGSTDGSKEIIEEYLNKIDQYISEPDDGISHAFNKGIGLSTGDLVGFLNSGDIFHSNKTLQILANKYIDDNTILCGSINYIKNGSVKRLDSRPELLKHGMYVRHPGTYIPKELMNRNGLFSKNYKISMDYEYMLRILKLKPNIEVVNQILVDMQADGVSSNSFRSSKEELKAKISVNGFSLSAIVYYLANVSIAALKKR